MDKTKAYGYARISLDLKGDEHGVTNQQNSIRKYAKEHGLELVEIFTDNSISATKGLTRPAFEELLKLPKESTVIVFANDRLVRKPTDLERVLDREFTVYQVSAGAFPVDLSTPAGRFSARMLVNFAAMETEQRVARMEQANEASFKAGKAYQATRSFGNDKDGSVNAEGEALRELVPQLIDREINISDMARELNERELYTAKGKKPWSRTVLSRALKNKKLMGIREYKGQEVELADWEPVLTKESFDDLQIFLKANAAKHAPESNKKKAETVSALLNGIAKCSICGANLYAVKTRVSRKRMENASDPERIYWNYQCPTPSHMTVSQDFVNGVILNKLSLLLLADAENSEEHKEANSEIRKLRKEKLELENNWAEWLSEATDALLPPSTIKGAQDKHTERVEAIDAEISSYQAASVFADVFPLPANTPIGEIVAHIDQAIEKISNERKRTMITELFEEIVIDPYKGIVKDRSRIRYTLTSHGAKLEEDSYEGEIPKTRKEKEREYSVARAWLREQGHEVKIKGTIPKALFEKWEVAGKPGVAID